MRNAFAILFLLLSSAIVSAHKSSDSYLRLDLTQPNLTGQWDIAIRDLALVLPLDANLDGEVTWGELRAQEREIVQFAFAGLNLKQTEPLSLSATDFLIDRHSDGAYVVLRFKSRDSLTESPLNIRYSLFFDIDAQHRGIVALVAASGEDVKLFSPAAPLQIVEPFSTAHSSGFLTFFVEGIWHIWKGIDHVLFVITLLLPLVVRREHGEWKVAPAFRPVLGKVAAVITAFTVAHSITLLLAASGVIRLPSMLVESVIAMSVVLAAVNNLVPIFRGKAWLIAFGFGLIHGFGFANVFADLGVGSTNLLKMLVAFNLGVEAGQMVIVLLLLPVAFAFRNTRGYRVIGLGAAPVVIIAIASTWTFERLLDFKVLPF